MEEKKIATDAERVQLAEDVLKQLAAGSLCGVPSGNWFVGFPMTDALPYFSTMHLSLEDFGEGNISSYNGEEEDNAKEDTDYWVVGARGPRGRSSDQPHPVCDLDLQEVLTKLPVCEVCAVGSLVVAAAKRYDNMKVEYLDTNGVFSAMSPYFERQQLLLIELVYEKAAMSPGEFTSEQRNAAADMWDEVPTGSERLKLIMQNIVSNNGTFVVYDTNAQEA